MKLMMIWLIASRCANLCVLADCSPQLATAVAITVAIFQIALDKN